MGGRGANRFAAGWTRKQLSNRVSTLDAKIKAIDDEAKKVKQAAYRESMEESRDSGWRSPTPIETRREWARMDANEAYAEYILTTNRGELVNERKKLKSELNQLDSGQRSLFG